MLKNLLKYEVGFITVAFLISCTNVSSQKETTIAQVGEKKLFLEDVSRVIPKELNNDDSLLMADDYIKKWVKQELLIQKAEENLSEQQKNVSKELKEYRNSLILYKYKNELMKQHMDTLVTEEQIQKFYNKNKADFNLNQNIVKAIFIEIPVDFANPAQLKEYCTDTSEEGLSELREYCVQYAKKFDIFIDKWVNFDLVVNNLPEKIDNPGQFLSHNKWIEMKDSTHYFLVRIHDFKLRNEQAPVEYVKENIKNLILNRKKIEFLKQMEENVYLEGVRKNKFKIFNRK